MSEAWPKVPLGEVVQPADRWLAPEIGTAYRQLGVRLWGEGAYEREVIDGGGTKYAQLNRVEADDLVVNKIWARNGSVAVVQPALSGCVVSGEFPTYTPCRDRIAPRWLHWMTKTAWFWHECDKRAQGTSGKNRIKPEQFLAVEIPLPPLAEQRRIAARLDAMAAKIEEAKGLRAAADLQRHALWLTIASKRLALLADECPSEPLGNLISIANYGTSLKCSSERLDGATPVLRIPNVARERLDLGNLKYAVLGKRELSSLTLCDNDILIVRTNGSADLVGRAAVVRGLPEACTFASYLIRLRVDTSVVSPQYVHRVLKVLRDSGELIDFARTTAGQYNVSLGRLQQVSFPIPAIEQQSGFVNDLDLVFDEVGKADSTVSTQARALQAMLPSALDRAFGGAL